MPVTEPSDFASAVASASSDAAILDLLTGPSSDSRKPLPRRDSFMDPLLLAATAASGPNVTRNHYAHDFFPGVMMPQSPGSYDWTKWSGEDATARGERKRLTYVSRQGPRKARLQAEGGFGKENDSPHSPEPLRPAENIPHHHLSRKAPTQSTIPDHTHATAPKLAADSLPPPPVEVKCMARTRIPTPHGPVFLHLYHNNRDSKEHLAIVVDPSQYDDAVQQHVPPIRSRSLDAIWNENETEMDRLVRGAYLGKLSSTSKNPSLPSSQPAISNGAIPPPLVRIHSECFTGETVGSMRCDCGEQLDEAIRLISQPTRLPRDSPLGLPDLPGRGVVVYLRQEGRGIGLLSKIRAYNLQDMGHDTVAANLLLGYGADERNYEIAGAILRDLGVGSEQDRGLRLLTNNPDKVAALENEGVRVVERVPMVPRSWKYRSGHLKPKEAEKDKAAGLTMIGGEAVRGDDLDKYLRTKVERMGHMLPLYLADAEDGLAI